MIRCSLCRLIRDGDLGADGYDWCPDCRAAAAAMTAVAPEMHELLSRIDRGQVTITPVESPADVYCGNVSFAASTGHRIVVFNDCGQWDYVDSIFAPDGRLLWDYPDGPRSDDAVSVYRPPDVTRWGFEP